MYAKQQTADAEQKNSSEKNSDKVAESAVHEIKYADNIIPVNNPGLRVDFAIFSLKVSKMGIDCAYKISYDEKRVGAYFIILHL